MLRTAFAGQSLRVRARQQRADRTSVDVQSAIATQRLKPPRALPKQGTQKIGSKKPAPKKGGTQPLKPLVPSGTQIKKVRAGTRHQESVKCLHASHQPNLHALWGCAARLMACMQALNLHVASQLTSIALFGEKGKGFRPRQSGPTRAAPALLAK
jgi:hypothetical protein